MNTLTPSLQEIADKMVALSQMSREEQANHPDIQLINDRLMALIHTGEDVLISFSVNPDAEDIAIKDNPMLTILAGSASNILQGMARMFVDPQDLYAVVAVMIGALLENGTLTLTPPT